MQFPSLYYNITWPVSYWPDLEYWQVTYGCHKLHARHVSSSYLWWLVHTLRHSQTAHHLSGDRGSRPRILPLSIAPLTRPLPLTDCSAVGWRRSRPCRQDGAPNQLCAEYPALWPLISRPTYYLHYPVIIFSMPSGTHVLVILLLIDVIKYLSSKSNNVSYL